VTEVGTAHGHVVRDELLKLQKKGQFPDEPVKKKGEQIHFQTYYLQQK
jgi:hypothetical protein